MFTFVSNSRESCNLGWFVSLISARPLLLSERVLQDIILRHALHTQLFNSLLYIGSLLLNSNTRRTRPPNSETQHTSRKLFVQYVASPRSDTAWIADIRNFLFRALLFYGTQTKQMKFYCDFIQPVAVASQDKINWSNRKWCIEIIN